jgi:hypothetical protein
MSVPRVGLTVVEASQALGISDDCFRKHVLPGLRIVRLGRRRVIPVAELQRFVNAHAGVLLESERVE